MIKLTKSFCATEKLQGDGSFTGQESDLERFAPSKTEGRQRTSRVESRMIKLVLIKTSGTLVEDDCHLWPIPRYRKGFDQSKMWFTKNLSKDAGSFSGIWQGLGRFQAQYEQRSSAVLPHSQLNQIIGFRWINYCMSQSDSCNHNVCWRLSAWKLFRQGAAYVREVVAAVRRKDADHLIDREYIGFARGLRCSIFSVLHTIWPSFAAWPEWTCLLASLNIYSLISIGVPGFWPAPMCFFLS